MGRAAKKLQNEDGSVDARAVITDPVLAGQVASVMAQALANIGAVQAEPVASPVLAVTTRDANLVPLAQLRLSEGNVRRGSKGDLDQLAADILAHGLLQNLTGVLADDGNIEIVAGGRRLRAMQQLVKRKQWPPETVVPVIVLEAGDTAREAGLAENFQRLAMSPADEARAFAVVVAGGASEADVAARFGVTVRHVAQRLRLAALAPAVLDALAKGKITLDVAQAFASVPDAERQAKVLGEATGYVLTSATFIRRLMQRKGYAAGAEFARFVGRDDYVAHGGSFAVDLFTDEDAEHWLDDAIVDRLAGQKLVEEAAELRARFGFHRVIPFLRHGDGADVIEGLESAGHWTDWTQKPEAERTALVVRCVIENGAAKISEMTAWYAPGTGAPVVEREAAPASSVRDDDPAPAAIGGGAPAEPEPKGLSGSLQDALAMRRRDALALALLRPESAGEAAALLIFTVLEEMSRDMDREALGVCLSARAIDLAEPLTVRPLPWAGDALDTALVAARADGLDWSWQDQKTTLARWQAFLLTPPDQMERFAQVAIGATLKAWGNNGARILPAVQRDMGQLLGVDAITRGHWRPTAANYFDRCGKAACMAFLLDGVGAGDFPGLDGWGKLKKAELAALCEQLAAGDKGPIMAALSAGDQNTLVKRISAKFAAWLPAEICFGEVVA